MSSNIFEIDFEFERFYRQNDNFQNKSFKTNKENILYEMVYKPNEKKEEKKQKMKELKEESKFLLEDEKEYEEDILRLFGKKFVKSNKKRCQIIYNNKKYELREYLEEIDNNYNREAEEIKIKLIIMNTLENMREMFYGCYHLISVSEYKKEKNKKNNTAPNKLDPIKTNETTDEDNNSNVNDIIINSDMHKDT